MPSFHFFCINFHLCWLLLLLLFHKRKMAFLELPRDFSTSFFLHFFHFIPRLFAHYCQSRERKKVLILRKKKKKNVKEDGKNKKNIKKCQGRKKRGDYFLNAIDFFFFLIRVGFFYEQNNFFVLFFFYILPPTHLFCPTNLQHSIPPTSSHPLPRIFF